MTTYDVVDDASLSAARGAYLRACDAGAGELVIALTPGVYGADPAQAIAELSLSDPAAAVPQIDLTLRCTGDLAVLAGIPVKAAARSLTIERIAIDGAGGSAISAAVEAAATLRDVIVLGAAGDPHSTRAVVDLQATGSSAGAAATLERVVIASSSARDAGLMLAVSSGAWWESATLAEVDAADVRADALVAAEALRTLRARRSGLDARASRRLLRVDLPIVDGELDDVVLVAAADALIELRLPEGTELPPLPPLRIGGGSSLSGAAADLPELVELSAATAGCEPALIGARVAARVEAARARVTSARAPSSA